MPLDQYVIGSVIGKGSYGEVTLASYKKDKKKVIFVLKYSHKRHPRHCHLKDTLMQI